MSPFHVYSYNNNFFRITQMELNLYGISSIKLDKLKKRQIRRFLLAWIAVYAFTILISTMFPKALEMRIFNTSPSVGHSNKNSLELKECVRLQKDQHDYFEMTGNIKIQLFKEPKKDESLNLAFNVSLYTTESFELSQECAVPSQSLVKSQTQIKQGWNVIVQNQLKNRTLTCTKDNNLLYKCMDVPILKGDVQDIIR